MRLWATLVSVLVISSASSGESDDFARTAIELLQEGEALKQMPQLRAAYAEMQYFRLKSKDTVAGGLTTEDKAKLEEWFAAEPKFRENFLLALHPVDDNHPEAVRVALALRAAYPNECAKFPRLVIAYAVVWDSPDIITRISRHNIPELAVQPYTACTPVESFGWFAARQPKLPPWFGELPWQLSKYLAADWSNKTDRDWVAKNYQFNAMLGKSYSDLLVDGSKLKGERGRMGDRQYTLENLKLFGGVCRDQAYFARTVCGVSGVPAFMSVGVGSSGMRRAWVGWVTREKNEYKFSTHGRNPFERGNYEQVFDPQTTESTLDYVFGIEVKAMSNEKGYADCDLCFRTYLEVKEKMEPKKAIGLLITGLNQNPYHRRAWQVFAEAVANGEVEAADAEKQWAHLNTSFREIPEFTISLARQFAKTAKSPEIRLRFYDAAAKSFSALKRIDIVAKVRLEQIDMALREISKEKAAEIAGAAMQECAGADADGLSLAQTGDRLYRELNAPKMALAPLETAMGKTPPMRGTEDNPNWLALAKLASTAYTDTGNTERGKAIEAMIKARTSAATKPAK